MIVDVDFDKTSSDYATHRAGFPASFYERLLAMGIEFSGKRLVDIGTGTGTLARGFAQRGAIVTGIDPSPNMLAEATRLAAGEGLTIEFVNATAEHTGCADAQMDLVSAGQCWHWFDRPAAGAEVYRILKPGGRIIIAHYDWIPLPGNLLELTENLICQFNPAWRGGGGTGIYRRWYADVSGAGFKELASCTYDEAAPYTHEAWRGRVRASAGIAASLPADRVKAFDSALAEAMARHFPADPLAVHHRVFILSACKPS